MLSVSLLTDKSALQHRCDECSRNAVARDVYRECRAGCHPAWEIVEIANDRAHREIASSNLQASDAEHCARENRRLDLASDIELFVYSEQAMLISEITVGGHIAKAADEKQESENYVVQSSAPQTKVSEIAAQTKAPKTARPIVRARIPRSTAVPSRETGE